MKKEITTADAPRLYTQKEAEAFVAGYNSLIEEFNQSEANLIKAEKDLAEERRYSQELEVQVRLLQGMLNTQHDRLNHVMPLLRDYGDQLQKANTKVKELEDLAIARLIDNNNLRQLVDELTAEHASLKIRHDNAELNLTITRNALGDALLQIENLKEELGLACADRDTYMDDINHYHNAYKRLMEQS